MRLGASENGRQRTNEEQVDVEELEIGQIGADLVEDHDRDELRQTVRRHVFEDAERGDQSAPALPNQFRHAADAGVPGRERRRHRRLRIRQRDAGVRRLQRPAIVRSVSAHSLN